LPEKPKKEEKKPEPEYSGKVHFNPITGERREYSADEYVDFITGEIKKKKQTKKEPSPEPLPEKPKKEEKKPEPEYSGKVHFNPITGKKTHLKADEEVDFFSGKVVKMPKPRMDPNQTPSNDFEIQIDHQSEQMPRTNQGPRKPLTLQEKHKIKMLIAITIVIGVIYSLIAYSNSNPIKFTIVLSLIWIVFVILVWKSASFNRLIRSDIPQKIKEFVREPKLR
jgi:hypothetical protein